MITIKSNQEIELMKEAGRIVALTQKAMEEAIKPGISTYDLDVLAEGVMKKYGAKSAEKGYPSGVEDVPDFPANTCISLNDVVIHGIPSKKQILKEGDIVSIDLVTLKNGFNADMARTYIVGKGTKEAERLVTVTKQAFYEGLKFAKKEFRVGDISYAIGEYVKSQGFNVVREFQGHGIGKEMHEDPGVPNYGKAGRGPRLEPGMTICIEPMVIAGEPDIWELEDGWTIATQDGSMAAHYENTVLITEKEPKILTIC